MVVGHVYPSGEDNAFLRGAVFNLGHVVGFALATGLAVVILARIESLAFLGPRRVVAVAAALMAGLAVLSEAAQYPLARDASPADLARDVAGIGVGALVTVGLNGAGRTRLIALTLAGLVLAAAFAAPVGIVAAKLAAARGPAAFGFETWLERRLIHGGTASIGVVEAPPGWEGAGHVLRVTPRGRARREGVTHFGFPRDWSGYDRLVARVGAAEGGPRSVLLVIESPSAERGRHRYRGRFEIDPEPRELSLNLHALTAAAEVDLGRVYQVKVLAEAAAGQTFYVDDLRLE